MPRATRREVLLTEAWALARQGLLLPRMRTVFREHAPAPRLTVFIHGYLATGGVLAPFADHLAARGVAPRQLHFSYPPLGSIHALATRLAATIDAARHEGPLDIVGHSLGGLVARYYRQVLGRRLD